MVSPVPAPRACACPAHAHALPAWPTPRPAAAKLSSAGQTKKTQTICRARIIILDCRNQPFSMTVIFFFSPKIPILRTLCALPSPQPSDRPASPPFPGGEGLHHGRRGHHLPGVRQEEADGGHCGAVAPPAHRPSLTNHLSAQLLVNITLHSLIYFSFLIWCLQQSGCHNVCLTTLSMTVNLVNRECTISQLISYGNKCFI
jgi:hypothetical protein